MSASQYRQRMIAAAGHCANSLNQHHNGQSTAYSEYLIMQMHRVRWKSYDQVVGPKPSGGASLNGTPAQSNVFVYTEFPHQSLSQHALAGQLSPYCYECDSRS